MKILSKILMKEKTVAIEKISIEENTRVFIEDFSKLIKKGNKETIQKLIKFLANSIQGEFLSKCFYNDRNYGKYDLYILHSLLLDLSFKDYQKCDIKMNVSQIPIISCVWNHKKIIDNLYSIGVCNGNPFNGVTNAWNISACLVEPLGLVIVLNGNHSVNSAIIHNEGEINVDTKVDISSILERYKFDGKNYIDIYTKEKVSFSFLKNNSEPFTYILGLFFEMARVLKINKIQLF